LITDFCSKNNDVYLFKLLILIFTLILLLVQHNQLTSPLPLFNSSINSNSNSFLQPSLFGSNASQNLREQFPNFPPQLFMQQQDQDLYQRLASIEVNPNEVTITQPLGEGFFGTVYKGNKH
jgi:hypothetical protein